MVLASGLGEEAVADWRKKGGAHLHQLLKFLTVRTEADKKDGRVERSGITALGGPHDPALDGAIAPASECAAAGPGLLLRFAGSHQVALCLRCSEHHSVFACTSRQLVLVHRDALYTCTRVSSRTHPCCKPYGAYHAGATSL